MALQKAPQTRGHTTTICQRPVSWDSTHGAGRISYWLGMYVTWRNSARLHCTQ